MKKTFMSIAVLALSLGMAFAASDTKTTYYDWKPGVSLRPVREFRCSDISGVETERRV